MTTRGMTSVFAGFRFPREVIAVAVRWYLRYGLSYRDVEELLAERGVTVDHVTVYRWVQRFTPEFIEPARLCRHIPGDCWFVDETYVKVSAGGPICTGRLTSMARSSTCCCLCGGTWPQPGGSSPGRCAQAPSRPRSLPTVHTAYPRVLDELIPSALHVTVRYANNRVEADHGQLKARLRPMRGLKRHRSARILAAGHALVQNIRRGHCELATDIPAHYRLCAAFDQLAAAI